MAEWQPIETAPRDLWVLGFIPEGVLPQRAGGFNKVHVWPVFLNDGAGLSGDYWEAELGEEGGHAETGWYPVSTVVQPTHWMPLPEPPSVLPLAERGEGE